MSLRQAILVPLLSYCSLACGGSARTSFDRGDGAGAGGGSGANGGSAGAVGGAGSSGGSVGEVALGPGSWEMSGEVTPVGGQPPVPCTHISFTLNVSAAQRITVGSQGQMDVQDVTIADGKYFTERLGLPNSECQTSLISVEDLTLTGIDDDGDGVADRLSGVVQGTSNYVLGDVGNTITMKLVLTGRRDVSAPELFVPDALVNPMVGYTFLASEPLALPQTSLELVGPTTTPLVELPRPDDLVATSAISWPSLVILPLSGEWSVQGKAEDLSGHPLPLPQDKLRTLLDPGVFAQDGFEGPLTASVLGGMPALGSGHGSLPAITGAKSLWLDEPASLLVHLQRKAAEKTLIFSARAFSASGGPVHVFKTITVGVVGGTQLNFVQAQGQMAGLASGDSMLPWASEVFELSAPLEDSGTDVLLSISNGSCVGLCPPPTALLIDDLRLE